MSALQLLPKLKSSLLALAAGATLVAFSAPTLAAPVVIDFEDLAVSVGTNSIGGDRVSRGFTLDSSSNHTHLVHDTPIFNAWNGTTTLQVDNNDGANVLSVSRTDSTAFSLLSVDLGEGAADTGNASVVRVTGHILGGGTVVRDIRLDGVFDQSGPLNDFQTELFGAGWGNLSSVDFVGLSGAGVLNYLLDNIATGDGSVPLPGTLALVALGLALVPAARRK
jgi:hypothetical protein